MQEQEDFIQEVEKAGRIPIYICSLGILHDVASSSDDTVVEVNMDTKTVEDGEVGVTFGAHPCIAGIIIGKKPAIFHSTGDTVDPETSRLIQSPDTTHVVVGGSQRTFALYQALWNELTTARVIPLRPITPRNPNFSIAWVRSDMTRDASGKKIKKGIYYAYTSGLE